MSKESLQKYRISWSKNNIYILGVPEEERQKGVEVLFKQTIADGERNEINEAQKSPSRLNPIGLYQETL